MDTALQTSLFQDLTKRKVEPFRTQLLKWVGNKQRFAHEIASYFPVRMRTYYEPFLGSAAVLGTLTPDRAVGSDAFAPLIDIWKTLQVSPESLKSWYAERWHFLADGNKQDRYETIRDSYNAAPNAADLLFISRSCYGGVVRFRKSDGHISTPCGAHRPVAPEKFASRVDLWQPRVKGAQFVHADFRDVMRQAGPGDVVYCDPPYSDSQAILYGAQSFRLQDLLDEIEDAKMRGAFVALSIDGSKRSGKHMIQHELPRGLFKHELFVHVGRSMLKRFQMNGASLEGEVVADRLLLTH